MKPKRNVWLMYAIALLQGMVFYGPIATLYRQAAGITIFQITIIESVSLILCLFLELPWGVVADKIGYKKTMIFCTGLNFISKLIFWQADSFASFLLERILLSVIIAGLSGVDTSVLYLSCENGKTQRAFGIYNNLQTVGLLFAALTYSVFIKNDYRLAGLLTAIGYGVAAILALGLIEVKEVRVNSKGNTEQFIKLMKGTLGNKRLLLFLVGVALFNETHQTITVFLNQLQYQKCGLSNSAIGLIYIGVTLTGLLGVLSHRVTQRYGVMPLITTIFISVITACAVLSISSSAVLSVAAIIILRIAFSLFQPLQMDLQNRQVISSNRATELSINAVLIDSVGVGTNLLFGKLAEINLSLAMLTGAALCLIAYCFICVWKSKFVIAK